MNKLINNGMVEEESGEEKKASGLVQNKGRSYDNKPLKKEPEIREIVQ